MNHHSGERFSGSSRMPAGAPVEFGPTVGAAWLRRILGIAAIVAVVAGAAFYVNEIPAYDLSKVSRPLRAIPPGGYIAETTMFPLSPSFDFRFTDSSGSGQWVSFSRCVSTEGLRSCDVWVSGQRIPMTDDNRAYLESLLAAAKPADAKTRESVELILHPNRIRFRAMCEAVTAMLRELLP